ncbi:hypothetical protein MLD38_013515 [Melastoma candidum]|uniref:Uncharacterized protein n=1 Tax=Melastoma candidum TaxID=119954 RepID=A0ACB9R9W0_9MYRT|nr:hypothetical protein MLD38_013515 [Melastoma candidum]
MYNPIPPSQPLLLLLLLLLLFTSLLSPPTPAAATTNASPFTPRASLLRYWSTHLTSSSPIPFFLLSKASPLSPVDAAAFAKLASRGSLSSHLPSFCAAAGLLCFPDLLAARDNSRHGDANFASYVNQNFTNYGSSRRGGQDSFKNYTDPDNLPVDTFDRYGRDSVKRDEGFASYATGTNVVDQRFNSYGVGAAGGKGGFDSYNEGVNVPGLSFNNYGSRGRGRVHDFGAYSTNANAGSQNFTSYGRNANSEPNEFNSYGNSSNVVASSFGNYGEGGSGSVNKFTGYGVSSNDPGSNFRNYGDRGDGQSHSFGSYGTDANAGNLGFTSYGKNGNGEPNKFSSYGSDSNVVGSTFGNYGEGGSGAVDNFTSYGFNGNVPENNFRSYGDRGNVTVDEFSSYRDQSNVGDDSFESYAKKSASAKVNFANYGKSFNEGTDKFTGYGQGAKGEVVGFTIYGVNNTFKEYAKDSSTTFSEYTNTTTSSEAKSSLAGSGRKATNRWVEPGKFFRESALREGTLMPMPDIRDKMPRRSFLPRTILSKLPFAKAKMADLKEIFHADDDSSLERIIANALGECERAPSAGETKRCVGSVEDMVDFATSVLGKNIVVRATENVEGSGREVMIGKVKAIDGGKVTESVSCHQSLYPYLLYYCHSVPKVRVYSADILDPETKARINHGVAICHVDTSAWSATHGAFLALGSGPGRIEVCHWIFQNDMTWTVPL